MLHVVAVVGVGACCVCACRYVDTFTEMHSYMYTGRHMPWYEMQVYSCWHCNTLKHIAKHCNTLHHIASHCITLQHIASHCNTLQHTATHCNTLQHIAAHCNTLQHIATHCNTLQHMHHTASRCKCMLLYEMWVFVHLLSYHTSVMSHTAWHCHTLHCNALHHTTTQYHTLQHAAICCNTL